MSSGSRREHRMLQVRYNPEKLLWDLLICRPQHDEEHYPANSRAGANAATNTVVGKVKVATLLDSHSSLLPRV